MLLKVSVFIYMPMCKEVQVGNDQEIVNKKEISTPKTEGWKKTKYQGTYTKKTYRKPSEQLFPKWWSLSYPNLTKNMKKKYENVYKTQTAQKFDFKRQNN